MTNQKKADGRSPWTRPGFLFGGAFVVLILVLGVVLVVTTSDDPADSTPTAQPAPPAGDPAPAPPADEGPTTVPTSAPPGVRWELFQTVALPYSAKAGPRQVDTSVAAGYAHTPTGALLAASHIPVRKLLAPNWQQVVERQVMPGPGRDAFAAARATITDATPAAGQLGQFAGFRFVNYSPDTATVQLVNRFVSGRMQVTTITVQWDGTDWRLALQPDGSDSPSAQKIDSVVGYIEWGGV